MNIEERLDQFRSNMSTRYGPTSKLHNMYVLQTIDADGNVTDEKYGMNVMTTKGFYDLYFRVQVSHYQFESTIFVGSGTSAPTVTATSLEDQATTTIPTADDRTYSVYEDRYDPSTGTILSISYRGTWTFPYICYDTEQQIDPETGTETTVIIEIHHDITISELGWGWKADELATHSLVYDMDGNLSPIVKGPTEKLTIRLYMTTSMPASLIQDLWNQGIYAVISPSTFMVPGSYASQLNDSRDRLRGGVVTTSPNNQISYNNKKYPDDSANSFVNVYPFCAYDTRFEHTWDLVRNTGGMPLEIRWKSFTFEHLFEPKRTLLTWYGFESTSYYNTRLRSPYWFCERQLSLPTPEAIEVDNVWTNNFHTQYLDCNFGWGDYNRTTGSGRIPVSQFHLTAVKMYNFLTDAYDISVPFHDAPNRLYDTNFFHLSGRWYPVWPDGTRRAAYVHANPYYNQIAIKEFLNTGIILYATDTFWNPSTWEQIYNLSSVPAELQSKKYYICNTSAELSLRYYESRDIHGNRVSPSIEADAHRLDLPASSLPADLNGDATTECYPVNSSPSTYPYDTYSSLQYGYVYTGLHDTLYFINGDTVTSRVSLHNFLYNCTADPDYVGTGDNRYCNTEHDNPDKTGKYLIYVELNYMYSSRFYRDRTGIRLRVFDVSIENPTYENIIGTYYRIDATFENAADLKFDQYRIASSENSPYYIITTVDGTYAETVIMNLDDRTQTLLRHAQYGNIMHGTNYMIYFDTIGYGSEPTYVPTRYAKIYDMTTNEIVQEFEYPYTEYTFISWMAMNGYIYIQAKDSANMPMLLIYSMESQTLDAQMLDNIASWEGDQSQYCYNDITGWHNPRNTWLNTTYRHASQASRFQYRTFTIGSKTISVAAFMASYKFTYTYGSNTNTCTTGGPWIITTEDPYKMIPILAHSLKGLTDTWGYWYSDRYVDLNLNQVGNNIYLGLAAKSIQSSNNQYREFGALLLDIGYTINRGSIPYDSEKIIPANHFLFNGLGYTGEEYNSYAIRQFIPYGSYVIGFRPYKYYTWSDPNLQKYPIQLLTALHVEGTTTSVQCWNNPKKLSKMRVEFTLAIDH